MYTDLKNVSILIAQLKKHNISRIVISAGTRHIPFVFSVEKDKFFTTYSIVDERSASFFALGLIEKLHEPVAIVCTSGTAACNYVSAVNEAYYQKLPLVVLTADRNNYYTNQQEEQMVMQPGLYGKAVLKSVTLPIVRDEKDEWYCGRLVNEALLELNHRNPGPVHINFQVEDNYPLQGGILSFSSSSYVETKKITRLSLASRMSEWENKVKELLGKRVLIIYGQHFPATEEELEQINRFSHLFNCVFSVDLLSNLVCDKSLFTYNITPLLSNDELKKILPDIVITMNGHTVSTLKARLKEFSKHFEHWNVSLDGEISDPFKVQSDIIECNNLMFFKKFSDYAEKINLSKNMDEYYQCWQEVVTANMETTDAYSCKLEFSEPYVIQKLMSKIPQGSNLHLANSNTVRIANSFRVHSSIEVSCNRGTHGIDGSMSAFIGQSTVCEGKSFLIIGDLSFFYDMNAFWNRYVSNNVRILVCNNSGGGIFHSGYYKKGPEFNNIDEHIAAGHSMQVKHWAEANNFIYFAARNENEYQKALACMMEESTRPVLVEAFTNMDKDIEAMNSIMYQMRIQTQRNKIAAKIPEPAKKTIKKLLGK